MAARVEKDGLRRCLLSIPGEEGAEADGNSWVTSIGEDTKGISGAPVVALNMNPLPLALRPSIAGDMRGVKYSPGIVYSGTRN